MIYDFEVSDVIGAKPEVLYGAWLDSAQHTAMTGAPAEISPVAGGEYSAWDGYITGQTISLEPVRRIVQTWRSQEFESDEQDSAIDVVFEPEELGTRVTIRHSNVPSRLRGFEEGGWQENYFDPMKAYFEAGQ
ncbi:MAG: SRPBCC domain-containing protein [Actinomycetes bacterium]